MADQNITALPAVTTPESSDKLLLVGATEEKLIDYDKLADAILGKIASKNFALDQGNKTLLQALNELNSKTKISVISPKVFESGEKTRSYKLSPLVLDQSILCICRSEVYLITLGQRGNSFNTCYIKKILDAPNITDATVKLDEERRSIIFTCDTYENPVFVGKF